MPQLYLQFEDANASTLKCRLCGALARWPADEIERTERVRSLHAQGDLCANCITFARRLAAKRLDQ